MKTIGKVLNALGSFVLGILNALIGETDDLDVTILRMLVDGPKRIADISITLDDDTAVSLGMQPGMRALFLLGRLEQTGRIAACEDSGSTESSPRYEITELGRDWLKAHDAKRSDSASVPVHAT